MNVDCALFRTCFVFFLCVYSVLSGERRRMRKSVVLSVGLLCVLIGSDWGPTCCSAVFGTPLQTAATPLPLGRLPLRLTSSRCGTPSSPPMLNATGAAPRPQSQRSNGLWYVATGNSRQMAARDCIERFQIMASCIIVGSKVGRQLLQVVTSVS